METGGVRLVGAVTALAVILNCPATALSNGRPHIIFIVADDLGWNDVSWHNPQIISPNLGRLAREGVILNSSSRSAFMAGRFPYHTGLQHGVIRPLSPHGLSLNFTLLPQKLKEVGYSTHGVGKWHLGFCKWEYTPTRRGFDTYVGYFLGDEDYFYHTRDYDGSGLGYDFRYNTSVYTSANGTYSAHVFGQRAVEIIKGHDPATPLFLYLPFQSVHQPLQVPQKYEDMYPNIKNVNRRKFCGMVTAMDEAVGNITSALEQTGLIDNALIIFTTDNGGPIVGSANNWPLRGAKATLWEGGNKGSAFVYSKNLFSKTGYTNTEMIHAVDWYPTLLHLAGAQPEPGIDGVNQWDTLRQGAPSARTEFVYNIDDLNNNSAIRMGKYKLIKGVAGHYNGWYPPPTLVDTPNDTTLFFRPGPDTYRLFDIDDDPTEHFDLASKLPDVLAKMKARLMEYRKTMVPADDPPSDHRGDPGNFGGFWSPGWC